MLVCRLSLQFLCPKGCGSFIFLRSILPFWVGLILTFPLKIEHWLALHFPFYDSLKQRLNSNTRPFPPCISILFPPLLPKIQTWKIANYSIALKIRSLVSLPRGKTSALFRVIFDSFSKEASEISTIIMRLFTKIETRSFSKRTLIVRAVKYRSGKVSGITCGLLTISFPFDKIISLVSSCEV